MQPFTSIFVTLFFPSLQKIFLIIFLYPLGYYIPYLDMRYTLLGITSYYNKCTSLNYNF